MNFKLLPEEVVLDDEYPVYFEYVYIVDNVFRRSPIEGNVGDLKKEFNAKEIRRCELFARNTAKIGDKVE